MNQDKLQILPLHPELYPDFAAHMERHVAESGRSGVHFMPFLAHAADRPVGVTLDKLLLSLNDKGWHRCWVAFNTHMDCIVGHVDLKGSELRTGLHRCQLGLGIEEPWRGQGLGNRLMDTAMAFARAEPQLHWIDLNAFATNLPARALYLRKGFIEVGCIKDRFRLDGQSIDSVQMCLQVKDEP
jgi:RimJ/RimL family protein N-acetyltransferase